MNEHTETGTQNQDNKISGKGRRILIINIVFFIILFGGMFLVPLSGPVLIIAVVLVAFAASILYTFLF